MSSPGFRLQYSEIVKPGFAHPSDKFYAPDGKYKHEHNKLSKFVHPEHLAARNKLTFRPANMLGICPDLWKKTENGMCEFDEERRQRDIAAMKFDQSIITHFPKNNLFEVDYLTSRPINRGDK